MSRFSFGFSLMSLLRGQGLSNGSMSEMPEETEQTAREIYKCDSDFVWMKSYEVEMSTPSVSKVYSPSPAVICCTGLDQGRW